MTGNQIVGKHLLMFEGNTNKATIKSFISLSLTKKAEYLDINLVSIDLMLYYDCSKVYGGGKSIQSEVVCMYQNLEKGESFYPLRKL